jgi:hypothetical protein
MGALDTGVFSQEDLKLRIWFNDGTHGFAVLSPAQPLTSAPYALTAAHLSGTLPSGNLGGTYSNAVTLNHAGNRFEGNGAGLTGLNATQLAAGTVPDARLSVGVARTNQVWLLGGNAGTVPGSQFLGTTDGQPLELKVKGERALRLELNGGGPPNLLGGAADNQLNPSKVGVVIVGGGGNMVGANYGSIAGGAGGFIGTTSDYSAIGGGVSNSIYDNSAGGTISGGKQNSIGASSALSFIGGGTNNAVASNAVSAVIAGGQNNRIGAKSPWAAIGGGYENSIATNSPYATIGGGRSNSIPAGVTNATIAGGYSNTSSSNYATVVGGYRNVASGIGATAMGYFSTASGDRSTALGSATASGYGATATGLSEASAFVATALGRSTATASWSTAMGLSTADGEFSTAIGNDCNATGYASFAAGHWADALHSGSFVWSDYTPNVRFASTGEDQFCIQAHGGVYLSDATPSISFGTTSRQMINLYDTRYGIGVQTGTLYQRTGARFSWFKGGTHSNTQNDPGTDGTVLMTLTSSGLAVNGTFVSASDRHAKEGFEPVNAGEVLDKVLALPLSRWSYKADEERSRHLGPMAQDFHASFGLGPDDKHIATVDADGVALAAIQGLNQRLMQELKRKQTDITTLTERLEKLERLVNATNSR